MPKFNTVEQYFSLLSGPVKARMEKVRETIRKAAPGAEEVISYNMPAFRRNGMLVWYAAYANHIGLYPTNSGIEAFREEIAKYKSSKGAVQFRHEEPLPVGLIGRMVKYRVKTVAAAAAVKATRGKKAATATRGGRNVTRGTSGR